MLSGAVEVYFETGQMVKLAKGDSLYFDSRVGHAYISTSRQLARTLGASTSESNLMRLAKRARLASRLEVGLSGWTSSQRRTCSCPIART